ncbi:MAG: hypothetical protein JKY65_33230 [Planctomycetes bacterium]|nr:hypothetical protein [Planctomycetota bacterium]
MIAVETLAKLKAAVDLAGLFRSRGVRLDAKGWGRCPFHEERTPSFHARRGRFKCFGCGASGDALDALQELDELTWTQAADELRRFVGADSLDDLPPAPMVSPRPEPRRAPKEEVLALWDRSTRISRSGEARVWLRYRGFDPERVATLDLCRWLPTAGFPPWAGCGDRWKSWADAGYRVAFPTFDDEGQLAGLRGRPCVRRRPKALPPCGVRSRGLLLANVEGVSLLQGAVSSSA